MFQIIIDSQGKTITKVFEFESEKPGSYYLTPVAFSPDGRYIVFFRILEYGIVGYDILDGRNNYEPADYYYQACSPRKRGDNIEGFISQSKIIFWCDNSYLVLDLNDGSVQKQNKQFVDSVKYITDTYKYITSPKILNVQYYSP